MKNFIKEELESGITLVTEKKSYFNSISIGLWVKTGSSYEPPELNGISHFIEHLLFKGTKTRTSRVINKEIDLMGGALNAFTGMELTCLYTRVLSENYDKALNLLIDIMFNSSFPKEEMAKEKGVILQEILAAQDDPYDYAMELFHNNFYGDSPYGRPILGTRETVEGLDRDKIREYYYSNYSPENLVISIAGNFNYPDIVKSIDKYMSSIPGKFKMRPRPATSEISKTYGNFLQEKDLEQTHFIVGVDGLRKTDKDYYVLEILNTLLGGSVSSRLFRELRENKGLAYSIYSNAVFHRSDGYVYIYAGISPKRLRLSKKLIFNIMDDLVSGNIKEEEISNAKKHVAEGFLLGLESTSYIMNNNAINEIYNNRYISKFHVLKKINSTDKASLKEIAKKILGDKNRRHISIVGRASNGK